LVFGGAPNFVEHEQKILLAVSNCTWTSSPITGPNWLPAATAFPVLESMTVIIARV
jgi:hypothetical protein